MASGIDRASHLLSLVESAQQDTTRAAQSLSIVRQAEASGAGWVDRGKLQTEAHEAANRAAETLQKVVERLIDQGAERDGGPIPFGEVPLHLLDTPAGRRFLTALENAQETAAEVDRERGWVDGDGTPSGYSEDLAGLLLRLRREVIGPAGRE